MQDLNNRYRQVPSFGKGVIRRFTGNPSAMRKLAARDFEDLLQVMWWTGWYLADVAYHLTQCALPVFEGLLHTQREDNLLKNLIFDLATWHAYAKLRLHTDTTLNHFKTVTSTLGKSVRVFIKDVCSQYDITELPHEIATRGRRQAALTKKPDMIGAPGRRLKSTRKEINLSTYKYHALGDYPDIIATFDTTDNTSTQTVRCFLKTI